MGGIHQVIGFLESEDSLRQVDPDFRDLVRLSYAIPGFGSHGVSCSGHFYLDDKEQKFSLVPGSLGFMALPEEDHVMELLRLISYETQKDSDAIITIDNRQGAPRDRPRYDPSIDLKPYARYTTKQGRYVARLEILLGDNGCLRDLRGYYGSFLLIKDHQKTFELAKRRCAEIRDFWKGLEVEVREYNSQHNFVRPDFNKKEFLPFM